MSVPSSVLPCTSITAGQPSQAERPTKRRGLHRRRPFDKLKKEANLLQGSHVVQASPPFRDRKFSRKLLRTEIASLGPKFRENFFERACRPNLEKNFAKLCARASWGAGEAEFDMMPVD